MNDHEDAALLTLERDLRDDLRRRAGAIDVTVPPVESVVDRRPPRDHRWLVVAAAVVAIVVLAAAVLRLVDRPQSVQVGRTDGPASTQPVTLAPASGWRVAQVVLPVPTAGQPTSTIAAEGGPGPLYATDDDHAHVLSVLPYFAAGAYGPAAASPPPAAEPLVTDLGGGVLRAVAAVPGTTGSSFYSFGFTRDELVELVAHTTSSQTSFDVAGLPRSMHEVRFEQPSEILMLTPTGNRGDSRRINLTASVGDASSADLVVTNGVFAGIPPTAIGTSVIAGRSVTHVRNDSSFIAVVDGVQPGQKVMLAGDVAVDDDAIARMVEGIRPVPADEWAALQQRCAPGAVTPGTAPCS